MNGIKKATTDNGSSLSYSVYCKKLFAFYWFID